LGLEDVAARLGAQTLRLVSLMTVRFMNMLLVVVATVVLRLALGIQIRTFGTVAPKFIPFLNLDQVLAVVQLITTLHT